MGSEVTKEQSSGLSFISERPESSLLLEPVTPDNSTSLHVDGALSASSKSIDCDAPLVETWAEIVRLS